MNINKAKHSAACLIEATISLDEVIGRSKANKLSEETLLNAGVTKEEFEAALAIIDKNTSNDELEEIIKKRALRNMVRYAKEIIEATREV